MSTLIVLTSGPPCRKHQRGGAETGGAAGLSDWPSWRFQILQRVADLGQVYVNFGSAKAGPNLAGNWPLSGIFRLLMLLDLIWANFPSPCVSN